MPIWRESGVKVSFNSIIGPKVQLGVNPSGTNKWITNNKQRFATLLIASLQTKTIGIQVGREFFPISYKVLGI